jgi:hypothetical protein
MSNSIIAVPNCYTVRCSPLAEPVPIHREAGGGSFNQPFIIPLLQSLRKHELNTSTIMSLLMELAGYYLGNFIST